ncbi:hypothetical protein TNCV_4779141 [Trichonephila clavipes]|nr:hypothetical protein TNCV_4779141 [Trichonephila clavipes]
MAVTDPQKANLLANTIKNNFIENNRMQDNYDQDDEVVTSAVNTFSLPPSTQIEPVMPDEIINFIKNTSSKKAPEANTPEDIDEQIAAFTDRLHQAYKNASKPLKHNDTFYISRDLNQLFKERNRARKIWHYTRSPCR